MDGEVPNYLLAKDLILQIIGEISVAGATYKTMEFAGTTVESLSMEERMTLCNMVVEAGGKNGVIPADKTTYDYLKDKTSVPYSLFIVMEEPDFLKNTELISPSWNLWWQSLIHLIIVLWKENARM